MLDTEKTEWGRLGRSCFYWWRPWRFHPRWVQQRKSGTVSDCGWAVPGCSPGLWLVNSRTAVRWTTVSAAELYLNAVGLDVKSQHIKITQVLSAQQGCFYYRYLCNNATLITACVHSSPWNVFCCRKIKVMLFIKTPCNCKRLMRRISETGRVSDATKAYR